MLSATLGFLRRSWRLLVTFQLAALVAWLLSQGLTAESQVRHRAEGFRRALAEGRSAKAWHMVSADYRDQWSMDRDQIGSALRDVSRQFLTLRVEWVDPRYEAAPDGGMALTTVPRLEGKSLTPIGEMMLSTARQLEQPFTFHWKKEGWWPWTWRIVKITNPALEIPAGYTPGMFSDRPISLEDAMKRAAGQ
jgi:hypothetical protein